MPNIPQAIPAEHAELAQLRQKIKAQARKLHGPIFNSMKITLGLSLFFYVANRPDVNEALMNASWKVFETLAGMPVSENLIAFAKKMFSKHIEQAVANVFANHGLTQDESKHIRADSFCDLFMDPEIPSDGLGKFAMALYPDKNELSHVLQLCIIRMKNEAEFLGKMVGVVEQITELKSKNKKDSAYLAFLKSDNILSGFRLIYYAINLSATLSSVYVLSSGVENTFYKQYPLGVLGFIFKDYKKLEKYLFANSTQQISSADYALQRNHLLALQQVLDFRLLQLRTYSRYLFPLLTLFVVMGRILHINSDIVDVAFILLLSLIGSALSNVYPDIREAYANKNFKEQFKHRQLLLDHLAHALNQQSWLPYKKASLADSNFVLTLREATINNKTVAQENIHQALLFALIKHDFSLLAYDEDSIIISAEQLLTSAMKNAVVKSVLNYIEIYQAKEKLEEQLNKLARKLNLKTEWVIEEATKTNELPAFKFYLTLDNSDLLKILAILTKLNILDKFVVTSVDERTSCLMLNQVIEIVNPALELAIKPYIVSAKTPAALSLSVLPHKKTIKKDISPLPVPTIPAPLVPTVMVNFGRHGIFNSQTQVTAENIIELRAPYWPRFRHFAKLTIEPNDLPPRALYDKYRSIFVKGEVVAPRGQKGFVQHNRYILSESQQWQLQRILKIKDNTEDARIFEGKTVREQQSVLHVFDTVELRAHR
jgi:hypothetical protein